MYTAFFGLKESPFGLTPDPKYVFWSRAHREALAHLIYGVEERKGFILLTGEVGAGKTLLCRCLLGALGDKVRTALILNPIESADQFFRRVNQDFGISADSRKRPLGCLNAFLLREYARGRNCVLIIDETHTLPIKVLEQIRLISNLETERSKLVQIIMVGQEELNDTLSLRSMRQLQERIAVGYHLRGFDEQDTANYIRHRLRIASMETQMEFTPAVIRAIYRSTGGNPRQINILCDRALLAAYSNGRSIVDRGAISAACREMVVGRNGRWRGWRLDAMGRGHWFKRFGWAFVVCAGLSIGFLAGKILGWP